MSSMVSPRLRRPRNDRGKPQDLNAKVIAIDGKLVTIQTDLGEVKVSLEELDAKVVDVIDGIATM